MIGALIAQRFGVRYHNHHVPRLLHELGFSVPRQAAAFFNAGKLLAQPHGLGLRIRAGQASAGRRSNCPRCSTYSSNPRSTRPNRRAEQTLRPAVVNRKVSGGNCSDRGTDTQQVLTSIIRTARQRGINAGEVLVELLHTPQPVVSRALQSPTQ